MAKVKNWAVTNLTADKAMVLNIEGIGDFDVVQYTGTFAKNEVPRATCLVAIGRDARSKDAGTWATIHKVGMGLTQMKKATLYFEPTGDWKPGSTTQWKGRKVIFEGYYVGMAYRKILEKVQPVLHLIHWLVDLGFSSTMCSNLHPSVPSSMGGVACMGTAAGIQQGLGHGGAMETDTGTGQINFVGNLTYWDTAESCLEEDLWAGMKSILCDLSQDDRFTPGDFLGECINGEGWKKNDRAQRALKRIEGPGAVAEGEGGGCSMDYKYAKPLKLDIGDFHLIKNSIAESIASKPLESYAGCTFWDALLTGMLPEFGMAIVPLVDRALVIADCPAFRQSWTKTIGPDDYDGFDWSGMISQPLWGVGLICAHHSDTGAGESEDDPVKPIGGGFVSQAAEANDGMLLVQNAPSWLNWQTLGDSHVGETTGIKDEAPGRTMTSGPDDPPKSKDPKPSEVAQTTCGIIQLVAQQVFIENMLRGRSAMISGKLRFDIAPGSVIRIEAKPELFAEGIDQLAVPMYGQVERVTININSEARLASTTFNLGGVRTETENGQDRTSTARHPLFGTEIFVGAPLVDDDWLFEKD